MPGMSRAALVADLKASLLDAARPFSAPDDADFIRHLDRAAEALARVRRRTLATTVTLEAGRACYPAPADMLMFNSTTWGAGHGVQPWMRAWPGRLPDVRLIDGELVFVPAPTTHQIAVLGAACPIFYYARHTLGEDEADTTVAQGDRSLLLLRAQAEAMRELAMRDSVRPAAAQSAYSTLSKTGTPAALAQWFLDEFERRTRQ